MGDGIRQFKETDCRSGRSLKNCIFDNGSTARGSILNRILNVTWTIKDFTSPSGVKFSITPDNKTEMKFNDMRYWDTGYELYLLNVQNGIQQSKTLVRQNHFINN